ncbi:hypothetical protein ACFL5Q_00960 [Planctomycetota bacterium]
MAADRNNGNGSAAGAFAFRLLAVLGIVAVMAISGTAAEQVQPKCDYLKIVRGYADAMIGPGRDISGNERLPLFSEALDRRRMRLLEGELLETVAKIPREGWGIRPHDRMIEGANPQHCQNLYQVLYALGEVTGEPGYAEAADRSLEFFFERCQSPATGLFCWGEHAGWDFRAGKRIDKPAGNIHEFYRPWVLWDRSWQVAPEPCRRFALGLWEHQVGNHETGDYSRHATIDAHGAGTEAPYARHGGFFVETWAAAYEKTRDEVFLRAIETVLDGLERARVEEGGMLVGGSKKRGSRRAYDLSLAVSLGNSAPTMPPELAAKMRAVASVNDRVFAEARAGGSGVGAGSLWSNAYGAAGPAGAANLSMLRYRQVGGDAHRQSVLQWADVYREREVDLSEPVWPGTMGSVVFLMLNAHELTGDAVYLDAADRFAEKGVELFLGDGRPLPKASHVHDHYEAVTNGDTLMMSLMRLCQVRNKRTLRSNLVFTDR